MLVMPTSFVLLEAMVAELPKDKGRRTKDEAPSGGSGGGMGGMK